VSRSDPARLGRHHHHESRWARLGRFVLVVVAVVTTGGVGLTAVSLPASGDGDIWTSDASACLAPTTRMPLGKQGASVGARAAWLAAAHHLGAPSPRPHKATLCSTPTARGSVGWVAAVAHASRGPAAGATRAPSSRGPPAA
jgi:hypothetical protein